MLCPALLFSCGGRPIREGDCLTLASIPMALQLKQMEVQLEEEYEDKQKALREKRELESKLATLSDQVQEPPPACPTSLGMGEQS